MLGTASTAIPVSPGYDLLYEQWLPVLPLDGGVQEVSLLDFLRRAHELRELASPSPLVTYGIYRFLAAVLHSNLTLDDENAWVDAWTYGRFHPNLVATVEDRSAGRLRLFDPDRPLYQSRDVPLPPVATGRPPKDAKTVGYLFPEASTGTNIVHFSHPGDRSHACCPACCAGGLLSLPPFATSGGAGIKPSINGVPPIYVLPAGRNLLETLLLNYILPQFRPRASVISDPGPLWTGDGTVTKAERSQVGFLESLTWPPRRVRLFPGPGGRCSRCSRQSPLLVRHMVFDQGYSRPKELPPWEDPWVAYRVPREGRTPQLPERLPIRPSEGRDLWRDFAALFLAKEGQAATNKPSTAIRPAVLQQIDVLLAPSGGWLSEDVSLRFETFAVRTDMKMKFFEWSQNLFDFPPALLHGSAAAPIEEALQVAEATERSLRAGVRQLHPVAGRASPDLKALRAALLATTGQAARQFWQRLELPFRQSVADPRLLASMVEQDLWLREWRAAVTQCAISVFEAVLDGGGFDADAAQLMRQQKSRRVFYRGLAAITRPGGREDGLRGAGTTEADDQDTSLDAQD